MSALPYAWAKAQRVVLCDGVLSACPSTPGWAISEVRRQFGPARLERVRD
ncbi:type II secretion system protein GspE, partial [Pseudomonas gingeri]|nr:type II secretion system protein GspE [Pseudomonas gingeri]